MGIPRLRSPRTSALGLPMRQESCTKVLRRPRQCVPFRARRPLDPCSGSRAKGGILKHSGRVEQTPRCPTRRDFAVGTARSRGFRPPRSRHRNQISPVAHGAGICTALTDIHFPLPPGRVLSTPEAMRWRGLLGRRGARSGAPPLRPWGSGCGTGWVLLSASVAVFFEKPPKEIRHEALSCSCVAPVAALGRNATDFTLQMLFGRAAG